MRATGAPDSEAHRHIEAVAPCYRTFALIAHLREAHGMTEVAQERAGLAHALVTRHDIAKALPIASPRAACRHPCQRRRRRTTGSPDANAISRLRRRMTRR